MALGLVLGLPAADAQPAPAVICTNPECNQLFLRRPGGDGRCPGCADLVERKVKAARSGSRKSLVALLALLALLALIYAGSRHQLSVTPTGWQGPIGSRVAFRVVDRSWFWREEDVTGRTRPLAHDTRVIRFEPHDCVAVAPGVGSTWVSFHYGDLSVDVPVVAEPADGLTEFRVAPANIDLAPGTTAELKAWAKDAKGQVHDVTAAVRWESQDPAVAACRPGLVEGGAPGETVLEASYTPQPGAEPLVAQATVEVSKANFMLVSLALDPDKVEVGQLAHLDASVQADSGAKFSLNGSSQLAVSVDPASIAKTESEGLVGLAPGKAQVQATFGALKANEALEVAAPPVASRLVVKPQKANLSVGERLQLDVLATGTQPLEAVSADPKIVTAPSARELLGQAPGDTEVRISQGAEKQVVKVHVEPAKVESLRIQPAQSTLAVGTTQPLRVIGKLAGGREIDLDPASLNWVKQPLADSVQFDRQALLVTGLAPTDAAQPLEVRYNDLSAQAEIKVQGDPKLPRCWRAIFSRIRRFSAGRRRATR